MPDSVLIVESRPASPEEAATYHEWYENTHLPEMLKLDGVVSARRLAAADGDTFIALYEIDGDVDTVKAALGSALKAGAMSRPQGVDMNPPPTVRWFGPVTSG